MTPQQIADQRSIADQKAFHRAELERLDTLEKAQRPALAAGQVWRSPKFGLRLITTQLGCGKYSLDLMNADQMPYSGTSLDDCFEYVGLARDVLRVVQPDAGGAMEQVAPVQDEPTGAELVGQKCWVKRGPSMEYDWVGPFVIHEYDEDGGADLFFGTNDGEDFYWYEFAKLYREGVTP